MIYLLGLTLSMSLRCLWIRRATWPSQWDGCATNSIVLLTINILMMTPAIGDRISPHIYRIFHVWNLEELFGHICYIGALMGFIAMGVLRLKMSDRERQNYLTRHIVLASALIVPIMVALFVWGGAEYENIGDLILERPSPRMFPYWIFLCASAVYLTTILVRILKALREDPRSRISCNLYLLGCFLSTLNIVFWAITMADPVGAIPMWVNLRVELIVFALGASWSWRHRVSLLGCRLKNAQLA